MKKMLTILLAFLTFNLSAQTPEDIVRKYVNLVDKYLRTAEDRYRDQVIDELLKPMDKNGERINCIIKDKMIIRN